MDKNRGNKENRSSLPVMAMLVMIVASGLLGGASFTVIKFWPQPASVAPYFGFAGGFVWGAIVGAVTGLVIGFLTDDVHFADSNKS